MRARWVLLLSIVGLIEADLFTSTADLQGLLETEKNVPHALLKYIEQEEERLENLKKLVKEYEARNENNIETGAADLANPINAFLIIKKKIFDWRKIENEMTNNGAEEFIQSVADANYGIRYPTQEDYTGAAIGLMRLQDTYRLDTRELADGKIQGMKGNHTLSAFDCFEIARAAYNAEDYYHVILWMEEAKRRNELESPPTADEGDILEYLSFAMYKQGNLKQALRLVEDLFKKQPNHPRAKGNIKWYEDLLAEEGVRRSEMRKNLGTPMNRRPSDGMGTTERNTYEALCRNEIPVSPKETVKLYCYYKMDRPFLRLAPFKVEIIRFNPMAVLFRGVLLDDEITAIKSYAQPKLARATVQNSVTGQLETASYRISKSAWLREEEYPIVERVNKRLELMTNLDMDTAEELQIANYGIGGHYDPHFDHARKEERKAFESLGTGNRIATVLFYMSQPSLGGATVFTEVKSTMFPSKNDALFWYNLHRNGEGDDRTRHAACPVLVGIKWVSNKWIHESQQEFRRPCGLRLSDAERYVGDLGGPEPRFAPNIRSTPWTYKPKKSNKRK
ncbi:unnamed protein product, partial [Mesorhabditis belari]|uniref:procollagen-proline 4-dioxygenase n=1 Tax=Mesorhabditis belari TaxID=2138241 RepID=A0AAF3EAP2_9BILA